MSTLGDTMSTRWAYIMSTSGDVQYIGGGDNTEYIGDV